MALSLNPHEFAAHPETGVPVLIRTTPYIRIAANRDPPIFLQSGAVYSEGGQVIAQEDWPSWALEEINKLKKHALEEVGFTAIVQKLNAPLAPASQTMGVKK